MTGDLKERTRVSITVTGTVQAVGFRPFVYRRATEHGLAGSVRNRGDAGVAIELEGEPAAIQAFLDDLEQRPPPLAVVESVTVEDRSATGESTFTIEASDQSDGGVGTVPPDTGICDACLEDVRDEASRYHGYWATSCVDCGPRYTVIEALPYDRPRTAMAAFPMCEDCRKEFEDPANRRYHAQTIACAECGPELSLRDADRTQLAAGTDAVARTRTRLESGEILAVRGIGGTHLACLATDRSTVDRLRELTGRPGKPFALMASSIESIEGFAAVDDAEKALLEDVRRPIVVLEGRTDAPWLDAVAPGLNTVGVMLPYAGLHHLLFDGLDAPLVMTSANRPGRPMCTSTDAIFERLGDVIDGALVHDREIVVRCDDSVVRSVDGTRRFLRRSRGWVPTPLSRPIAGPPVLALGAGFDVTIAIARDGDVVPSQHVGDVQDPDTEAYLRDTVDHLEELLGVEPTTVASDLHPDFVTTRLADELASGDPVRVQHHHAHAAGLLGEHGLDRAIVIVADGTGYGPDGSIWGGEVLDARYAAVDRVGGLSTFTLPGGEAAIERPGRILASLLRPDGPAQGSLEALLAETTPLNQSEARTLIESRRAGINTPTTTSAGRFLDAVSARLGVCNHRRYQGEPARRLEAAAAGHDPIDIEIPTDERDGESVLDVHTLMARLDRLTKTHEAGRIAATAQWALATGLADIAVRSAAAAGVDAVGFSGGVAYNDAIARRIREVVENAGVRYLAPDRVPPGDAGIAYGQALVGSARR